MIKTLLILVVLLIFFSPVFLFIKLVKSGVAKRKQSSWTGKLADKKHLEYEDDDSTYTKDRYTLYFDTTKDEEVKINVSKKIYDSWKIGDKGKKTKGELHPQKIG